MKRLLFLGFLTGIILPGCSKNSDNNASIVGNWNVNKIIAITYSNGIVTASDTIISGSLEFASNGNFTSTDETGDTSNGIYTYNTSTKLLTVISGGDTSNLNVTNLTSTNLHFTGDESEELGGFTVEIKVDADYRR